MLDLPLIWQNRWIILRHKWRWEQQSVQLAPTLQDHFARRIKSSKMRIQKHHTVEERPKGFLWVIFNLMNAGRLAMHTGRIWILRTVWHYGGTIELQATIHQQPLSRQQSISRTIPILFISRWVVCFYVIHIWFYIVFKAGTSQKKTSSSHGVLPGWRQKSRLLGLPDLGKDQTKVLSLLILCTCLALLQCSSMYSVFVIIPPDPTRPWDTKRPVWFIRSAEWRNM